MKLRNGGRKNDIDGVYNEMKQICEMQPYSEEVGSKKTQCFD